MENLQNFDNLAGKLKELRLASGKNQAEFAKMLEIPQTTWSGYESGKTRPKLAVLIALEAQGYIIKGLNTGVLHDMVEDGKISKSELQKRLEIARALATESPPETPIDESWEERVDAEYERQAKKITGGRPVPLYSQDDFSDGSGFEVPLLNQALSAGNGSVLPEKDEADAFVRVPAHLKRFGKNLAALTVEGDSMYPTLDRGDLVICDSVGWSGEGIYALRMSGAGFVKRVTRDPGKILIISDNPKYPIREYKEDIEGFEIIGRVHCAIKSME